MANAMKETAKEIKVLNKLKQASGAHLRSVLTLDELHALNLPVLSETFDGAVELLRQLAKERIEAKRVSADQRMALIGERYQKVLARGLAHAMGVTEQTVLAGEKLMAGNMGWALVTKAVLHTAYMTGGTPALTLLDAHPGSRAGVFIVDLRDLIPFASREGVITPASIAARVMGKARP